MSASLLVEEVMEVSNKNIVIPAHVWTPWFGLFGASSGFDQIEDCYQDMTKHIHALETGLSSDPPMNWRLSALDKYALVSNSDSHSSWPWRIGREANIFELERLTYDEVGDHLVTVMVRDPYQALARATFTVTVMFVDDTSPIARAGRDVMVGLNETAFFDGSASSDNVEVVSWTWTFEYRNGLVSLAGPTPSFEFEEAGTYVVGLRVHDARGNAGIDTITVTVGTDVAGDDYADGFAASALVVDRHLWVNLAGLLVLAMAFVVSIVVNEGLSKHHETTRDLKVFFRNSSLERTR